ncbi:LLM class flavin-dependent oxidoreductase [Novosphingobium sp. LASN5T]|uniref:LLM class flavin-dependent oxidoreductase n=1 Tax=Novosphingobium sp. LASN5T TaxID=2491021 RepID=UPI000F5E4160|nr:LLM class flavin-dependent oxidoreductase [Novosphingobium sp. LASN5T]RQW39615.1 LLM class flavin-dependent oxidoreductase [Novosphingobium sp. LASN5T]
MKLSVLDLVPVVEGGTVGQALAEAALLAQVAERCGYQRYWVAEHHGMEGIAGAAVAVTLAHVGHHTSTIRLGAGGIMLPNHNPLVIAEQFGTLDALYPRRIDLGLGRAPGADQRIVRALRKEVNRAAEDFPQDVVELQAQFAGDRQVPLQATPGAGAKPQLWILGSSLFGAQLAAALGLPYAFASHFAPDHLDAALSLYRDRFQPSDALAKPYVMAAINAIAADTDEEAALLASSMDQSFVRLRSGNPGKLPPPVPGYRDTLPAPALAMLEHMRQVSAIGSVATVRERLAAFQQRTRADELIVSGSTFDPALRRRSLELTMQAAESLAEPA